MAASGRRWTVAFASALMNAVQAGSFFMTPTTLMPEVVADFSLDLSVSTVPIAVGKVAYVLLLIPGGVLVDRYGPRRCVLLGIATIAALMTVYALFVRTFAQLLVVHVLMATAASVSGVPVYSIFIAQWFRHGIGLAMGLVLAGYSAAGTLVPALLGPIADRQGWRTAMVLMAAILWLVGLPVAYCHLLENDAPDDEVDASGGDSGEVGATAAPTETTRLVERPPFELRSPRLTFLGFAVSYILLQYCVGCFFENILFYLHADCGIAMTTASLYFSALNLASFSAKLAGGVLGDRYDRFHVASAMSALAAVAIMTLFLTEHGLDADYLPHLTTNHFTIFLFAITFGFGYGGVFNSLYSLVPLVFGRSNLGATQSSLFGIGLIGNAIGSVLTGVLRARFGTYQVPFLVAAVACVLNFVAFNVTRMSLRAQRKSDEPSPQPYARMEELRMLQNLEDAARRRIGDLSSPSASFSARVKPSGGGTRLRSLPEIRASVTVDGDTASSDVGFVRVPPRSLQELRLGASLASSPPPEDEDGLRACSSGFPMARDWSTSNLRRSATRQHMAHGGCDEAFGLRKSGTMESLVRSGLLSASLGEPGFLGYSHSEQALPQLSHDMQASPESNSTSEW